MHHARRRSLRQTGLCQVPQTLVMQGRNHSETVAESKRSTLLYFGKMLVICMCCAFSLLWDLWRRNSRPRTAQAWFPLKATRRTKQVNHVGNHLHHPAVRRGLTLLTVNTPSNRQPSPWFRGIFMELSMWPTSWRPISSWMSRPTTAKIKGIQWMRKKMNPNIAMSSADSRLYWN